MLSKIFRVSLPRMARPPSITGAGLNWNKVCLVAAQNENGCLRTWAPAIAASANRTLSSYIKNPAVATSVDRYERVPREEISAFDHDAPFINSWGDDIALSSSSVSSDGHLVVVKWSDDEAQIYPAVWLRDQCHCSECCYPDSFTRKTFLTDMNLETKIQNAFLSDDGKILSVDWADGHRGNFPTGWLRGHRFDQSQSDPIADLRPRLWGHDVMATADFSFFDFDEVMENDDALYEWLKGLYGLGIALLKNAPVETGQHFRLQNRLGYESPSPISSGIVTQVKLNQKSDHPAYSEKSLQLHNDMTYYNQAKGYQSFHCIKQASGEGGESLLVDAFKVAEELRHQNQEAFEMLTRIPWEFKLLMGTNYHSARREAIRRYSSFQQSSCVTRPSRFQRHSRDTKTP
ncbi:gamma-butyrobetaine dioxygenase-like isoform X2 [Lytechinus variegatus]|uniref:gamma-butyrobetaine dioxygenase-like isoform X2 n=1 Tax=Lytechinus variegatus TaxID=7654 RepID=UPI001BB1D5AD|nr:gamma-butyrobetaine dioxygenase-like isoform X2 [Lytechinus variegatus]